MCPEPIYIYMQDAIARHRFVVAASKSNKSPLPTAQEMNQWQHLARVTKELAEFNLAINKMRDVVNSSGKGSISPIDAQNAKSLIARCATSRSKRGECVSTGQPGEYISVAHLLRMAANIHNKADFRNMLERFAKQRDHRKGTIKDVESYNQHQDLRTGSSILAVFKTGDFTEPLFYVGQVRQLVAAISTTAKKRQVFLSVPCTDHTAMMVCYPWAQVDRDTGDLMTCEEPVEYYRVVTYRTAEASCASAQYESALTGHEVEVGGDEDECGPQEQVTISGSSIIMRSVNVDWTQCALTEPDVVLTAIETAYVL